MLIYEARVGDMISYNGNDYCVYEVKDNHCLGFKIDNYDPFNGIDINNITIKPIFNSLINEPSDNVYYIGHLNDEIKLWLLSEFERANKINDEKLQHPEKFEKMDAGWLICFNGHHYYVYGVDNTRARMVPIYYCNVDHPKAVLVNGLYYKPDYRLFDYVDFTDLDYQLVGIASERDIVRNEAARALKIFKSKTDDGTVRKEKKNLFHVGQWLKINGDWYHRYLLISASRNQFIVLSIDDAIKNQEVKTFTVIPSNCHKYEPTGLELSVLYSKLSQIQSGENYLLLLNK